MIEVPISLYWKSIVTIAAKTDTIATPVAGVYYPDAVGRVGLLN